MRGKLELKPGPETTTAIADTSVWLITGTVTAASGRLDRWSKIESWRPLPVLAA